MNNRLKKMLLLGAAVALLSGGARLLRAQDQGGPAGPPPQGMPGQGMPGGPGFAPPDPARMQEMMLERFKERLQATDEEWTAIKPLIADIMKLRMSQMRGRMGMMPPPGGPMGGPGGPGAPGMPMGGPGAPGMPPMGPGGPGGMFGQPSPEAQALQTALDSPGTSNDEIKTKLSALREAQKKSAQALQEAREKLKAVLTVRQEAQLLLAGILE